MENTLQSTSRGTDSRSATSDCGCGGGGGAKDPSFGTDFERMGRAHFLGEVQAAAREALAALPDGGVLRGFNQPAREVIGRMTELYTKAVCASKWSDAEIGDFAREMGWVKIIMDLEVASRIKNGGLGGYDTDCNKVYDTCMEQSGCTYSFFCICCIPCSAKHTRCVLGLPVAGAGIFIG